MLSKKRLFTYRYVIDIALIARWKPCSFKTEIPLTTRQNTVKIALKNDQILGLRPSWGWPINEEKEDACEQW